MSDKTPISDAVQIALAGGCFWCTESVFLCLKGVVSVESGYANGHTDAPTYEQVCTGQTGYAECVLVGFDPTQVSLKDLLDVFFATHDPTQLNGQGADRGTQYRSGVYTTSDTQLAQVQAYVNDLRAEGGYAAPIVTEVQPLTTYSAAEAYHQRFFERNPEQAYCLAVAAPKVSKARRSFASLMK